MSPEVADWFEVDEPTVVYRPAPPTRWPEEAARYALAGSVVIGCAVVLFAVCVIVGVALVAFARWTLVAVWPIPGVLTLLCVPWRRPPPRR